MANPFRYLNQDGTPAWYGKTLEMLVTWGEAIQGRRSLPDSATPEQRKLLEDSDAKWLSHNQELISDILYHESEAWPIRLNWNTWSQALVLTIGHEDDQVWYILGWASLTDLLRRAEREKQARRAALQVRFSVMAEQIEEFRELVDGWDDDKREGFDDVEPSTWAFWEEHPDLAPDLDSELGILEEKNYETFYMVRLWVRDAQTALSLGLVWDKRQKAWELQQKGGETNVA